MRALRLTGAAGVAVFVVCVVVLHLLPTGLDPIGRTVSEYVNHPYGRLIPVAGAGAGIGGLALGAALVRAGNRTGLLVALFGLAMLVVAVFPTDDVIPGQPIRLSPTGTVHVVAGAVAFLALAIAAPLAGLPLRWLPPAGLVFFVLTIANKPPISRLFHAPIAYGFGERVMAACFVVWLFAAAWSPTRPR
jgi:hypothetical protein